MKPLAREKRICAYCGSSFISNIDGATRKYCSNSCSSNFRIEYQKEYRNTRIKKGLCRECGKPARPGKPTCKTCLNKNAQQRHARVEKDPRISMYSSAKHRARQLNIPFSIDVDDIVIPAYCPVFGIELKRGHQKISDYSPTLDKIIPELGYIKGNVVVMSRIANRLKNNSSLIQLVQLGKWAEGLLRDAFR